MSGTVGTEAEGNTDSASKQRKNRNWCFTWNNYNDDSAGILTEYVENLGGLWGYGTEIAPSTGTPHLQGWIRMKNAVHLGGLKKIDNNIHWSVMKGSLEENHNYCSKSGNYKTNDFDYNPIEEIKLWADWQFEIEEICKGKPDNRKIYWYWEPIGNVGKTTLSKYLSMKYNAVPIEGKKNDILYAAANFPSKIYIYDIERSLQECLSYGALEKIKNGYFLCSKYESRPIVRGCPHVICFANFPPDTSKLSKDRFIIRKIENIKMDSTLDDI